MVASEGDTTLRAMHDDHRGLPELETVAADYLEREGPDLLDRWERHQAFWEARMAAGLDPQPRVMLDRVGPEAHVLSRGQDRLRGVNFASPDYLSLSSHPALAQAAREAIGRWGLGASGPVCVQGGSLPQQVLEERVADLLCCRDATVFPSGWAATHGVLTTLLREDDHVILDPACHPALREAAARATANRHAVSQRNPGAVAAYLALLRLRHPRAGLLVVAETVCAADSGDQDLRALRDACREHGATFMICAGHDLGAIGHGGLGFLGEQGLAGEVDIVVGSFSASFGSAGGFVAGNASGLKPALLGFAGPLLHATAFSPVQACIVLAAMDLLRSAEGAQRRRRLMANAMQLRQGLAARAFTVPGRPSGIVPVEIGSIADARRLTRAATARGGLVELVEHPEVPRFSARWRLHVMADHTEAQIDRMIAIAVAAREEAQARSPG